MGTRELLVIGRLGAPHGVQGEVRLTPATQGLDEALRLLEAAEAVWLAPAPGAEPERRLLLSLRVHANRILLGIEGLNDRTALDRLPKHLEVFVESATVRDALEEGEFLAEDLVGCLVVEAAGEARVGRVLDVRTGPQDLLVIEPEASWWASRGHAEDVPPRPFSVPFKDALVPRIDLPARRIEVVLPPGIETI